MRFCDFFVCETHFKGQQVNRSAWPTVEASNKSQVTIKLDHTEVNQLTIHLEACENHNKGPFLIFFFFNKQG